MENITRKISEMINVTKAYLPQKSKLLEYIDEIYDSGWLTNNGELVRKLEERLANFLKVENILLVSNGTLALQVAYRTIFEIKGEVITTPFSFVATTSSLVWENFTPKFVDICKETFNLNPNCIPSALSKSTIGILPVHVFGNTCDVDSIEQIAKNHNIKVIYDAAHAFGVNYNGTSILNYGDASILSFHSTKLFHTIEGGAIVFKKREDYEKAKLMINFGIPGYDQISILGINCKMNEFQAAMGLCILDDIDNIIEKRKKIWTKYKNSFSGNTALRLQTLNSNCSYNYSYFPIVFSNENILIKVKGVLNENDIWPRRYFYPSLDSLPYLKQLPSIPLPNSNLISTCILCLPIYPDLDDNIQNRIIDIILKTLD